MPHHKPESELGWIDFSETDKQKVMSVIELLKPDGTVDELGVGVIRNSLSDAMFPGITTIMTRAKYFFIVPRVLHDLTSKPPADITVREYLRSEENEIIEMLAKQADYNEDSGVIGITIAKHNKSKPRRHRKELMRKPSTIYWNGLRAYKIYPGDLTMAHLLDALENRALHSRALGHQSTEGETGDDRDAETSYSNVFSLPDYNKNWKQELKIELTLTEADFLKEKIIDNYPQTLLAQVLKEKKNTTDFLNANSFQDMCDMPFMQNLPDHTHEIVYTARDFWRIMYGAHIRYNIILHSRHGSEQVKNDCADTWTSWVREMSSFQWNNFDRELMWSITKQSTHLKRFTEHFINQWMDKIKNQDFAPHELDILVEEQEANNKQSRSKLRLQNDEKYDKWTGISAMGFRFSNAKTIISDIASKIYQ